MDLMYFKRFRMEIDLEETPAGPPVLPPGYCLLPWDSSLLEAHAEAKFRSFCNEIDSSVFPCLANREGCLRLMSEIAHKEGFLDGATWLATFQPAGAGGVEFCGTIQGIRAPSGFGAVQNLGIVPSHRGKNLGSCLMQKSLAGFRAAGLRRAFLEVTAQNSGAIRLYQRMGFRTVRIVYKAGEAVAI